MNKSLKVWFKKFLFFEKKNKLTIKNFFLISCFANYFLFLLRLSLLGYNNPLNAFLLIFENFLNFN